ncbi:arginine biosynthesis bifunctional protein ArgJ, chloroplastic [Phalaenopsis equestris]|uniref:arginine biosynthesis bifunctional protein ArgJ, chloroplastic n=1 Tax=Phalaenopsis equestris TaxID=78828 RepID=UPI0009E37E25|nr:arginine biosynthesis bifunctional protein ArgJ, chloroplastic [Phalaenopsis equestris]
MALSLNHPISLGIKEKDWMWEKGVSLHKCGVLQFRSCDGSYQRGKRVSSIVCLDVGTSSIYIPAAPIVIPEGPWKQIPGGVTAAKGFKAAGLYGGLRAKGEKPDLALVTCDVDAAVAGVFTTNIVAAAPIKYCRNVLKLSNTARAVLINAGQANAATGDPGYEDAVECAHSVAQLLQLRQEDVMIQSTGVIGQRIKKEALLSSLPRLVNSLSATVEGADAAAVGITTTDLVSKSVAIEAEVGGALVKVGGMAKGSGMIHPNMATMLGVVTTDALVTSDIWREMVRIAVNRSFNQISVDGDTSTNDCIIAMASGLAVPDKISSANSIEGCQLQACLDVVMQGLAKSIAWDGEGATCLLEVIVSGANNEAEAAKIARTVASSSLVKAAVYGRDPNWGRIACAVGYAGIDFDLNALHLSLGDIPLMRSGQPLPFDRVEASTYLKQVGESHGTVEIHISIGNGSGCGKAWGCDLSYDYIKINAEYTT